jgi:hypothetical protein
MQYKGGIFEEYIDLNKQNNNAISFTCKTNSIHLNYRIGDVLDLRTNCGDLCVMSNSKLHLHQYVNYISSQALKLLGLIRFITVKSFKVLFPLIRSKLECASVAWNNHTLEDSSKLENMQNKYANLCYSRFHRLLSSRKYDLGIQCLKFRTIDYRRQQLDGSFLLNF